jgi:hypothetical protein
VIFPSLALIFWLSSFFHGTRSFLICLFLCHYCLTKIYEKLFACPAFRMYSDIQTLNLSS